MPTTPKSFDQTERVERFQSLLSGQYWRATKDIIEQGIEAGEVLLIESIRWVDNAQHTVILRPHPLKIGKGTYLNIPKEDGSTEKTYFRYGEHRFLTKDFLAAFEHEPDYQRIRAKEIGQVQSRITEIQTEILMAQTDPTVLGRVVEDALRKEQKDGAGAALPIVAALVPGRVAELANGTVANAIGSGITEEQIAELRESAGMERQVAVIKSKWIQGKTEEIAETIKAMTPFYEEQAAAALAHTEDTMRYVDKLMQGIKSLDLYVGKDVEVQTVRTGEHAPIDTPLTLVQKKLLMDEELAVWTDIDSWFDFSKEELFLKALREHDDLVRQIFPTERCVLVMAANRRYIDYGDTWINEKRNNENHKVFLLIRNGMNIHRVFSSVESHLGTARLFPSKDDQDQVFAGRDGSQIKFEDVAYSDKLAGHEKFALHYKRFLLLICGLDHRLKLFGDFYEGPQSLDFVSMKFQERYMRFLHDDDGTGLLPGEQRQPLADWVKEKNAYLRSGSRVLCDWKRLMNKDTAPGAFSQQRGEFYRKYKPETSHDIVIAYRDGESICVDIEVTGYSYSGSDRNFSCKTNITKYKPDYDDSLVFLCLDAVKPEDLRWYIHNRKTRLDHLWYIQFFKTALKFVEQELASEQDTRQRLSQALLDGKIAELSEHAAIIDQAVIAWRAAHRGASLPVFGSGGATAEWKSLLDQMYMLAGEGANRENEIAEFIRAGGREPLRLVLSGNAKLVVYAAPSADECDNRLEPHAWAHRIVVEKGKRGYKEKSRSWVAMPAKAASETTLKEWAEAGEWIRNSAFRSFSKKSEILRRAENFASSFLPFTKQMSEAEFENQFDLWKNMRENVLENARYVTNPEFALPIGVTIGRYGAVRYICVGTSHPHVVLHRLAPNEAAQKRIEDEFCRPYANENRGRENFRAALSDQTGNWVLGWTEISHYEGGLLGYIPPGNSRSNGFPQRINESPLFGDRLDALKKLMAEKNPVYGSKGEMAWWMPDELFNSDGKLIVDDLLGTKKTPDNCERLFVHKANVNSANDKYSKYSEWMDISRDPEYTPKMDLDVFKPFRYAHSTTHTQYSRKEAIEFVNKQADDRWHHAHERIVVNAKDLPDAPQPPEGVDRYFLIAKPRHG